MGKRKRASITNTVYQTLATTPPKGEGVSRNGGTYTFKWKICDVDYGGGQWFRYRTRASISSAWGAWSGWTSIGVSDTSKDLALGVKYQVAFEIKGLRKAEGFSEILMPGELELKRAERNAAEGIEARCIPQWLYK